MQPDGTLQIPAGHFCITTYGSIRGETTASVWEMRSFSERNGLNNVRWYTMPGTLVEKARNEAVRELLRDPNAQWLCFFDGDMTAEPNALIRMLQTCYGEYPQADVLGGYCSLRGDLALPTIDSGTGTWESWFPNSGVVEVMRTGAAFLLVKKHVFLGMQDPWFRLRVPMRPLDALAEIDNFARIKFNGQNPFRELPDRQWERLEQCAIEDPSSAPENFTPGEVGEDSGFCDRARNAGFRIFVTTEVVTGHVDAKVTSWVDHKKAIENVEQTQRYIAGLL
jgi:hypothetical protein